MEQDECQCEKCEEWRKGEQEPEWDEEDEEDLLDLLDGEEEDGEEREEEMARRREETLVVSRAAEDQVELPQVLYVESEVTENDMDIFIAHTAIDTIEDEKVIGVYRLVDVKTVKKTVELV